MRIRIFGFIIIYFLAFKKLYLLENWKREKKISFFSSHEKKNKNVEKASFGFIRIEIDKILRLLEKYK
jgi:hypothetical protein